MSVLKKIIVALIVLVVAGRGGRRHRGKGC